ncbi:MAG: trigger factor family protein [Bacteroidetes bacterium]|nr:trigger factor family protein [Bacteroidota bacterium]
MNITQENLAGNEANINVHITADDYRDSYKQELKKYAKQVPMKGFRPGTVPLNVVQKMAGPSLLLDQLNKIVGQALENYLKENNIEILGDPMPEQLDDFNPDFENLPDFKFSYNVGFSPRFEFTVPSTTMDDYQIVVTDEDLDDSILRTRNRQPRYITGDMADASSLIKCDILDGNTPANSGAIPKGSTTIMLKFWKSPEEQAKFDGKKVGDIFSYNPHAATDGNMAEMSNLLGLSRDDVADYKNDIQILITEIQNEIPADLNSDFLRLFIREEKLLLKSNSEKQLKMNWLQYLMKIAASIFIIS